MVVVHHDLAVERIADGALQALDVEFDAGRVAAGGAVVGDGQERAPQRIQVGYTGRVGVGGCFDRGILLLRAEIGVDALCIPGR